MSTCDEPRAAGFDSDESARAAAAAIVARSRTSFRTGMRLLPPRQRAAMYAIYAFCREVDDIADEPGAPPAKLAALDAWRAEIERLYAGRPTREISRALRQPLHDFDLPKSEFLAIIEGMAMDAQGPIQAPPPEDYALYCRRVAGAVGMLSVQVFGETGAAGRELAEVLGEALQTTNILRDLAEDAERDRLYLPRDILREAGIAATTPQAVLAHPALPRACDLLARRSEASFARARAALARCERRRVRPARVMLEVYSRLLERLTARGWRDLENPVRLSTFEKLWIVVRHGLL
jgi:phytoene synthase